MHRFRGLRARIALTVVALVALTAVVLGVGAYAFVDVRLHEQLRTDAVRQATFNLAVLVPDAGIGPESDREAFEASGLAPAFRLRGDLGTIVEFEDGDRFVDPASVAATPLEPLRPLVGEGSVAWRWTDAPDGPRLVTGGVPRGGGPAFYFVFDATPVEEALATLRVALLAGGTALVVVALLVSQTLARRVLRPVAEGGAAAERIAAGDLAARVPVTSDDELGAWARRFNAMAATLEDTFGRLDRAQAQNRRFVSDVAHELRTPLTALVAEASLLRGELDALPPDARRAGELLVDDVSRLRVLVDELMELSRFDADAERVDAQPVELTAFLRAVVAARLPAATLDLPADDVVTETDPRRLDRIVGNLLDNAREHAPGAPVEVGLAADEATALVWVADRGPGVPPDELDRIFERFHKLDPSRRTAGSGLGLAIAAEHAGLLGGALRAHVRDGGGLRFELRLPVTRSLPDGDGPVTRADEAADMAAPAPRDLR